jgi:hypothetical protein
VIAVKNKKNDCHNDENYKNDVESRRPEEKYYTSSIPIFNPTWYGRDIASERNCTG